MADEKRTHVKKAQRDVLDGAGDVQTSWLDAFAIRYKSLSDGGEIIQSYDDTPDATRRAQWAFGALTHYGNITNTVRNGVKSRFSSEKEALEAAYADIMEGNWPGESGETEAGPTLLLQALVRVKEKADGKTRSVEQVRAIADWLSAQDKEEGDERKAEAKARRTKAKDVAGVAETILELQRERLAKRTSANAVNVDEIPG